MTKGSEIDTDHKISINWFLMPMPHAIYLLEDGASLSALWLAWYGQKQNNLGETTQ